MGIGEHDTAGAGNHAPRDREGPRGKTVVDCRSVERDPVGREANGLVRAGVHDRRMIGRGQGSLADQEEAIMALSAHLKSGETRFVVLGRTYRASEVQRDLADRFNRFKVAEEALKADQETLNARTQALSAHRDTLESSLGSPRDSARRGSHISIRHEEGYRINRAMIEEMNVIPDFRAPDNIRLGFAPLYISFADVWEGFDRIRRVVEEKRYENFPKQKLTVT